MLLCSLLFLCACPLCMDGADGLIHCLLLARSLSLSLSSIPPVSLFVSLSIPLSSPGVGLLLVPPLLACRLSVPDSLPLSPSVYCKASLVPVSCLSLSASLVVGTNKDKGLHLGDKPSGTKAKASLSTACGDCNSKKKKKKKSGSNLGLFHSSFFSHSPLHSFLFFPASLFPIFFVPLHLSFFLSPTTPLPTHNITIYPHVRNFCLSQLPHGSRPSDHC